MKTNKSYTKRIKVSKNGKLTSRKIGQGHFNAKESGKTKLAKGRTVSIKMTTRAKRRFLSNAK
ncbi:hypothetical protein A3I18_02360 [Candidatus Campbellbacteria bacterium RIFCSPLOWO2_02_FULL_35_11]|uniref:50S ribosomal protein L35 n=2 Tax=Candidatus Campbelliibacteriota TaxID=1752727 RepID=A0A1F5EPQ2_9BACT|nr:MAG: hypothetical protein A3E89_00260 [Candidatus Campbellbacteria bacterium RIFCSPHIGHO2_12_FULL_35_10]OGD69711.1 MAG: hypothetical protein A3I18_02360 [Candidatus Campbellbacteria bacterium RIFCSPLOWO2_02_FULL_35_11]